MSEGSGPYLYIFYFITQSSHLGLVYRSSPAFVGFSFNGSLIFRAFVVGLVYLMLSGLPLVLADFILENRRHFLLSGFWVSPDGRGLWWGPPTGTHPKPPVLPWPCISGWERRVLAQTELFVLAGFLSFDHLPLHLKVEKKSFRSYREGRVASSVWSLLLAELPVAFPCWILQRDCCLVSGRIMIIWSTFCCWIGGWECQSGSPSSVGCGDIKHYDAFLFLWSWSPKPVSGLRSSSHSFLLVVSFCYSHGLYLCLMWRGREKELCHLDWKFTFLTFCEPASSPPSRLLWK